MPRDSTRTVRLNSNCGGWWSLRGELTLSCQVCAEQSASKDTGPLYECRELWRVRQPTNEKPPC
eukprot:684674-Prymnesium_polylepis.1